MLIVTQTPRETVRRRDRVPLAISLPPIIVVGSILSTIFYALLLAGPLNNELLKRYTVSHPVCIASVWLFSFGMVGLFFKWRSVRIQASHVGRTAAALRRLVAEGQTVPAMQRVQWLIASWQAEPESTRDSWLGHRVMKLLQLQQSRGKRHQLEADLKYQSELIADTQYESYALLRIVHWAMPMLGFLGTVLGISQTLGQMDTQKLATQSQEAMQQITSGLYVAFDTTAIALLLTVTSMFCQFAINRLELSVMNRIDREAEDGLIGYLASDPYDSTETLLGPIRAMSAELVGCVRELVVEQATLWNRSIGESQHQWMQWTDKLSSEIDSQLVDALRRSLGEHLTGMEVVQEKAGRQFESRLQQWQTMLSDQTRATHAQHKEVIQQTAVLQQLVQSTADLRKLEVVVGENLQALQQAGPLEQSISRVEVASQCVAEAVALLASSLERAGLVRANPVRPRPSRPADDQKAATIPFKRKSADGESADSKDKAA
jgi:biopolymer transport protein ExbB/TolQ